MHPKEKALEIKNKFYTSGFIDEDEVKEMAHIAVDLIIEEYSKEPDRKSKMYYWLKVKDEI